MYPNPSSNTFNLGWTTSSIDNIGVSVYDMMGRLVDQRSVNPNEVSEIQIGDRHPTGIYNVIVTQGTEVKTQRVVKR